LTLYISSLKYHVFKRPHSKSKNMEFFKIKNKTRIDLYIGLLLFTLVFICKLPVLSTPFHWDEMGAYIPPAHWLNETGLFRAIPGFYPDVKFFGHPTGLYFSLALVYRIFGESIQISHLFAMLFAFLGLLYTYRLGALVFDRTCGVIASLLLFASPLYFAQAGLVLGDMPITAFGLMSVYYALKGNLFKYLLCASYMVMLKETSIAIVAAILVYLIITERKNPDFKKKALLYLIPGFFLFIFFVLQKIITGQFFCNPYFETNPAINLSVNEIVSQGQWVLCWTLIMQHRWVLILGILFGFLMKKNKVWRKEILLFLLILSFFLGAFSVIFFMTRYILSVLPYLCIMCAGAIGVILISKRQQAVFTAAVIGLFCLNMNTHDKGYHCYDDNMQYLEMVDLHVEVCGYVEENFPLDRVLTIWPLVQALQEPYQGYVTKPINTVSMDEVFDLVIYVPNPGCGSEALLEKIKEQKIKLHKRFGKDNKIVEIYKSE